jgi:hypothetical protein
MLKTTTCKILHILQKIANMGPRVKPPIMLQRGGGGRFSCQDARTDRDGSKGVVKAMAELFLGIDVGTGRPW